MVEDYHFPFEVWDLKFQVCSRGTSILSRRLEDCGLVPFYQSALGSRASPGSPSGSSFHHVSPPSGEKLVMSWDPVDPIVDLGTFHPLRDLAKPFMKHSEAQDWQEKVKQCWLVTMVIVSRFTTRTATQPGRGKVHVLLKLELFWSMTARYGKPLRMVFQNTMIWLFTECMSVD